MAKNVTGSVTTRASPISSISIRISFLPVKSNSSAWQLLKVPILDAIIRKERIQGASAPTAWNLPFGRGKVQR
jgi:hypothetical protein